MISIVSAMIVVIPQQQPDVVQAFSPVNRITAETKASECEVGFAVVVRSSMSIQYLEI